MQRKIVKTSVTIRNRDVVDPEAVPVVELVVEPAVELVRYELFEKKFVLSLSFIYSKFQFQVLALPRHLAVTV